MDPATQIELLDEILGLRELGSAYLDPEVTGSPVERYVNPQIFATEQACLFRAQPQPIAHVSELAHPGDFLTRQLSGLPLLLTRDRDGQVHAFYNVCRHRGARLVAEEAGCKHRFSCPYHAWTWDNAGTFINAPHRAQGFPDLKREEQGLKPMTCVAGYGLIWIVPEAEAELDLNAFLSGLAPDLVALGLETHTVHASESQTWACNWKIIVEGGLESYHFRVAHAKTIGALFHDNLSTYRLFGPHIRSILARTSIDELVSVPRADWRLREHANVLYNLFPATALLVQGDHVVWLTFEPLAADQTHVRITTLRPAQEAPLSEKQQAYWDKNHALTCRTLAEDFELGEQIQAGLTTGVNDSLTFGKFEGALHAFNQIVDGQLR